MLTLMYDVGENDKNPQLSDLSQKSQQNRSQLLCFWLK